MTAFAQLIAASPSTLADAILTETISPPSPWKSTVIIPSALRTRVSIICMEASFA